MQVEFKFEMYQKVKTPLYDGIITMLGYDDSGVSYFVKTDNQGVSDTWWVEERITAI